MKEQHKFSILYALIVLSTLPFLFIIKPPTSNSKSIALYLSAFFGYVGVSILLWMYILGTRSVVGLYFKNVPKTLHLHRQLGTYGTLLIFLHPLLVAYNYGENLLSYTFLPNLGTSFEKHVSYGRLALFLLLVVWATSAIIRGKIAFRPWKYIHYVSYVVLPLSFLHVPRIGSSFSAQAVQFYWYSFIATFLLFTALRMRHLFGYGKLPFEVIQHTQKTKDVFLLGIKPLGKKIHISPGQYVYVQLGLLHEEHPFTVLDYDNASGEMTIAYKVFGSYTKKMTKLLGADTVLIDGPYGVFTSEVPVHDRPSVFIAGGIGITPFVRHIVQDTSKKHWLFYANQTKQTAVFSDYLRHKMGDQYIGILSREAAPTSTNDEHGHISEQILKSHLENPHTYDYYICGPTSFISAAKNCLLGLGVTPNNVYAEEFEF